MQRYSGWAAVLCGVACWLSGCSSSSGESSSPDGGAPGAEASTPLEASAPLEASTSLEDAESPVAEAGSDGMVERDTGAPDSDLEAGGDSGLPPIDPSTPLTTLTPAQQAALCDWLSAELGGYGASFDCGGGISVSNAQNQMQCVMTRLVYRCPVTVGDVEMCILGEAPTHGCVVPQQACNAAFCGG
jgi:hypothetical protein